MIKPGCFVEVHNHRTQIMLSAPRYISFLTLNALEGKQTQILFIYVLVSSFGLLINRLPILGFPKFTVVQ